MEEEEKLITLIGELKNLTDEIEDNKKLHKEKYLEPRFLNFCKTLTFLYKEEQKRLDEKYIKPFRERYSFLEQESVLQVINKHHWETFHSLLLKHLWQTPKFLYSFIEKIDSIENKKFILQQIISGNYLIEEEHPIRNKRTKKVDRFIDLLITDEKCKWLIVIENKIYSGVSKNKDGKGTQLNSYYQYIKNNSNFKLFENKVYILLSLCNNTQDAKGEWTYADYYKVFSSILENCDIDNSIQVDYLKTLYRLLFNDREISSNTSLYAMRKFYTEVQTKINRHDGIY